MVTTRIGLQNASTEEELEQILRSTAQVVQCALLLYRLQARQAEIKTPAVKLVFYHTQVAMHFWAPWCLPCKQMDVVFAELAKKYPGAAFVRV